MTIELRPLGVTCNLSCRYCYQDSMRQTQPVRRAYDLEAMKRAVMADNHNFSLFGGEPLLLPKADLEELWKWGYERYGVNSVQTNATLIDDDHIEMFRKYRVRVGISIDGPSDLN